MERLQLKEKRGRKPAVLNKGLEKKSERKVIGKKRNRMRSEDD